MMSDNEPIENVMNTLDSVSKVFVILETIKDSKFKYIAVVDPSDDKPIMKIKLNLDENGMMDFLDTFFDAGFTIKQISKIEFDSLETNDIVKYNLK
jgi:hypothetical protein